jgi:hypothetical protein
LSVFENYGVRRDLRGNIYWEKMVEFF